MGQSIWESVNHGYAINKEDNVRIHFAVYGEGPLVVMVHGFPDFWYTWRHQIHALSENYKVVAVDLRGYNLSDKPKGTENYSYDHLVGDIISVIHHFGERKAILVGHDWGAAISWRVAMHYPDLIESVIICSVPNPSARLREFQVANPDKPTYADILVSQEFRKGINSDLLADWVKDSEVKVKYVEAFNQSDIDAMIGYYKANYPTTENLKNESFVKNFSKQLPNVKIPVLIIHGKEDTYQSATQHNNAWDYVDAELVIAIVPGASHFVHVDAVERVNTIMSGWLKSVETVGRR